MDEINLTCQKAVWTWSSWQRCDLNHTLKDREELEGQHQPRSHGGNVQVYFRVQGVPPTFLKWSL